MFDLESIIIGLIGGVLVVLFFSLYKRWYILKHETSENINYTYPMMIIISISIFLFIAILLIYKPVFV